MCYDEGVCAASCHASASAKALLLQYISAKALLAPMYICDFLFLGRSEGHETQPRGVPHARGHVVASAAGGGPEGIRLRGSARCVWVVCVGCSAS